MSVLKEDGTKRLIAQILASLKIGKYAIMDKALNINSSNPVENGVITRAINNIIEGMEGQVIFTCHSEGVGNNESITIEQSTEELIGLININKFQPLIMYIDNNTRLVPDSWECPIHSNNSVLIYMTGIVYDNSVLYTKKYKATYQVVNGNIVQNKIEFERAYPQSFKSVDVTVSSGEGQAYFTATSTPHLVNVVKKGTQTVLEVMSNLTDISGGGSSADTYPNVTLVDDTSNSDNRYVLVVRAFPTTNGTYTVTIRY